MAFVGALVPLIIQALPWLAAFATSLATAAYLQGVAPKLEEDLNRLLASSGIQKIRATLAVAGTIKQLIGLPLTQATITAAGGDPMAVMAQTEAAVAQQLQSLVPPLTYPTFAALQDVDQWRLTWTALYVAGVIPETTIRQVETWYASEWTRLSVPAVVAPVIPATQVAVPGFGTVGVTVRVGGVLVTPAAAPAVTAPQYIVVQAPAVSMAPPVVNVAAPNVTVLPAAAPQVLVNAPVDTAPIAASFATSIPLMATALAAGLAANAGPNAHSAQQARYGCQGGFIGSLLGLATSIGPQVAAGVILATDNPIRQALDRLIGQLIAAELDPTRFTVPTTYDQAVANASTRLTQAVGFGLQAQAISFTAEAMTPLKQMGFGQIAAFIGDLAGFKRVADGLMGTVESAAIFRPLMYEANRRFRPNIPDDRQLTLMFQKRSLTRQELSGYQERLGLPDLYIDRLPGFIFNDPNPGLIIRAFQIAEPGAVKFSEDDKRIAEIAGIDLTEPDAYFRLKLAKSGLDDTDVQAFVPVIKMGILRREQTIRYTKIEQLYRDGFIDEARAREEITQARSPASVPDYRMAAMNLSREYEVLRDTRASVLMAMSRGLVSRDEARAQLAKLGMPGDRVELEVIKATLGMIPGVRLTVSRPEELLEELPVEGV